MRPAAELAKYLNDYFAPEMWRPAGNLIGNLTVSDVANSLREGFALCDGVGEVQLDFDQSPSVTLIDNTRVRIRVPAAGSHVLQGDVILEDPLPDSLLRAAFSFEFDADMNAPNPQPDIGIEFQILSGFARGALAFWQPLVFVSMVAIETGVQLIVPNALDRKVRDKLAGLKSYRFDRTLDLKGPAGSELRLEHVRPIDFYGSDDPVEPGYIDLLLVSDGCRADELAQFDKLVNELAQHFSPTSVDAPSPFLEYRSAIRVWKIRVVSNDPVNPLQRLAVQVVTDRYTLNFSNLAGVAEIGLYAFDKFTRHPLMIIVTRTDSSVYRANTQGPYILIPLSDDVDTIIHEISHSPLGHYLADEYASGGGTNAVYRGAEPRPRNVSSNYGIAALTKWTPWIAASGSPGIYEGAYEHGAGIFRFAESCRMRDSHVHAFCPVCRGEIARGLLEHGHLRARFGTTVGRVDLVVEYLAPLSRAAQSFGVRGGSSAHLNVVATGENGPTTRVRLRLAGSSVPEHWDVVWDVQVNNGGSVGPLHGESIEIIVAPGALVQLNVRHNPTTDIFSPFTYARGSLKAPPETSVSVIFDQELEIRATDLSEPTELKQVPPVGAVLAPTIDAKTGNVNLPQVIELQARRGQVRGYTFPTRISFRVEGASGYSQTSLPGDAGKFTSIAVSHKQAGRYTWSVRTDWRNLFSGWVAAARNELNFCWEIAPIRFSEEVSSPTEPFDVQLVELLTFPPMPRGLTATSWHPNDRPINFQFEIKPTNVPFDGRGLVETGLLKRDPGNFDSVAITGSYPLSWPIGNAHAYHWRVRAADDRRNVDPTSWVEGRPFAFVAPGSRPLSIDEWVEFITDERLETMMNPRGPRDIPRLFVTDNSEKVYSDTSANFVPLKEMLKPR